MGRVLFAVSGLAITVLATSPGASPSAEEAVNEVPARVAARTETTEASADAADADLRSEYLKLKQEKAALEQELDKARQYFQRLQAETQLEQALKILTHVTEVYEGSPPAEQAQQLLECWAVIERRHSGANHLRTRDLRSLEIAVHPTYVEFGELIVNLDEGRLNRYLDVELVLQARAGERDRVVELVATNRVAMQDWLLSYLSGQNMEAVRGPDNHDRLRGEIRDKFNTLLFPDGNEGIDKVLFTKFAIQ